MLSQLLKKKKSNTWLFGGRRRVKVWLFLCCSSRAHIDRKQPWYCFLMKTEIWSKWKSVFVCLWNLTYKYSLTGVIFFQTFFSPSKLGYTGTSNSVLMGIYILSKFFKKFELLFQRTIFEQAVSQVHFPGRGIPLTNRRFVATAFSIIPTLAILLH